MQSNGRKTSGEKLVTGVAWTTCGSSSGWLNIYCVNWFLPGCNVQEVCETFIVVSLKDIRLDWQKCKSSVCQASLCEINYDNTLLFFHIMDYLLCIHWLWSLGKVMGPRGQLGGKCHYLTLMDNVVLDKSNDKWKNIHFFIEPTFWFGEVLILMWNSFWEVLPSDALRCQKYLIFVYEADLYEEMFVKIEM